MGTSLVIQHTLCCAYLILMSPRKSGIKSSVESYDKKNEKVLEFPESARIAKKIFFTKISPPPYYNPLISEWAKGELRGEKASHVKQLRALFVAEGRVRYWSPKGACAICSAKVLQSNIQGSHARIEFFLYKWLGLLVPCSISSKFALGSLADVSSFFLGGGAKNLRHLWVSRRQTQRKDS